MKDANSIIFIDTEFTSTTSEILELCVVNGAGEVLYHNHFKPVRAKYWKKFPHNITRTRVRNCRSFRRCLADIQPLFDRAELVCGFAVDNDFRHLAAEGLDIRADKALELRYLYWVLRHGTPQVADPFNLPGLSACATELCPGLVLDAEHSAKGDTLTTYRLFDALKEALPQYGWGDTVEAWRRCLDEYREGVADYYRRRAHGYVVLRPTDGGYTMVTAQEAPADEEGCVSVEVADRFHALGHFRDKFCRRLKLNREPYFMCEGDLSYIRSYTNTFDPTECNAYKRLTEGMRPPAEQPVTEPANKTRRRRRGGQHADAAGERPKPVRGRSAKRKRGGQAKRIGDSGK